MPQVRPGNEANQASRMGQEHQHEAPGIIGFLREGGDSPNLP